jgi:hypothetical protein
VQYVKEDHEESLRLIEGTIPIVIKTFANTKKQVGMALKWLQSEDSNIIRSGLETLRFVGLVEEAVPRVA